MAVRAVVFTCQHESLSKQFLEVLGAMLSQGANPNRPDSVDLVPLMRALFDGMQLGLPSPEGIRGLRKGFELLIGAGADPNLSVGARPSPAVWCKVECPEFQALLS